MDNKNITINRLIASIVFAVSLFLVAPAVAQNGTNTGDTKQPDTKRTKKHLDHDRPQALGIDTVINSDQDFIWKVAEGNYAEIELSKMALEKASSEKVKEYARIMVNHHLMADKDLAKVLEVMGVEYEAGTFETGKGTELGSSGSPTGNPPLGTNDAVDGVMNDEYSPINADTRGTAVDENRDDEIPISTELSALHKSVRNRLMALSGEQFDQVYMENMIADHQKMIALLEERLRLGENIQLKDYAKRQLPIIQEHLEMAKRLQAGGKAQGSADHKH